MAEKPEKIEYTWGYISNEGYTVGIATENGTMEKPLEWFGLDFRRAELRCEELNSRAYVA